MAAKTQTLRELIGALAEGAERGEEFVSMVRSMFAQKGIDLDSDASAYESALREAFACHVELTQAARQAHASVGALQGSLKRLRGACEELVDQVRELRTQVLTHQAKLSLREQQLRKREEEQRLLSGLELPSHLPN